MNIDWSEQPTPEHVALVSNIHDDSVLWMKNIGGGSYKSDEGVIYQDSRMFTVYEKPEKPAQYKPEIGEWCEYADKDMREKDGPMFYIGNNQDGEPVYSSAYNHLTRISQNINLRPMKTEREKFVEKAAEIFKGPEQNLYSMISGALYDNGARFADE